MPRKNLLWLALLTPLPLLIHAQSAPNNNPLLTHSNKAIDYKQITPKIIREAVTYIISESDRRVEKIVALQQSGLTANKIIPAYDELVNDIMNLIFKLTLTDAVFADDSTRNTAREANNELGSYSTQLYLNKPLYTTIKTFSESAAGKALQGPQKKFISDIIKVFEINGTSLPDEKRRELAGLFSRIIELGSAFDNNIAISRDSVLLTEAELKGVPEIQKSQWPKQQDKYVIPVTVPNYNTILDDAERSDTRREMYLHYNNRAYPANITLLDSLLYYRHKLAKTLGFSSFAEYALKDKMAGTPQKVWDFENDLLNKLAPHVTEELKTLRALKNQLHPEETDSIYAWDINFYNKKLLDTKYAVNANEIKSYFEMNHTLKGMLSVYEKLFDIQFRETTGLPVWDKKVKPFDVFANGKKAGSFLLDLYPRPNKFTHFACFPITQYRKTGNSEILPVAALVCNFPEGIGAEPSLLPHEEVITMFHEFGHLVHFMLGRSDIAMQGSFSVKGDFVEAPSQFLENWCWEYPSLKMLARHYKTGAPLPESLFNKIKKTENVNAAIFYTRQIYLGLTDFTFEDKYEEVAKNGLLPTAKKIFAINQIPYPEGSHFIASFGHLNSYGANYYGYLWSKVFAQDMFSVFKQNGIMDAKTGLRYRREVLEKASTIEETEMLRNFLGREPNSKAFIESLGLKDQ